MGREERAFSQRQDWPVKLACKLLSHVLQLQAFTESPVATPMHKTRVTWPDMQGRDLVTVREFEPSEPGESEIDIGTWEGKRTCCCVM